LYDKRGTECHKFDFARYRASCFRMQIKIAIADDHPMIIKGLQNMLANYPHITLTATYANGAVLLEGLR